MWMDRGLRGRVTGLGIGSGTTTSGGGESGPGSPVCLHACAHAAPGPPHLQDDFTSSFHPSEKRGPDLCSRLCQALAVWSLHLLYPLSTRSHVSYAGLSRVSCRPHGAVVNVAGTVMGQVLVSCRRQTRVCWGFDGYVGARFQGDHQQPHRGCVSIYVTVNSLIIGMFRYT